MSRPRPSHPAVVTREIFWSARRTLAAACLHPRRLPAFVMVRRSLHLPAKVPCYRTPPFSELAISVSSWSQPHRRRFRVELVLRIKAELVHLRPALFFTAVL
ncbi:hypothetical protein Rs2_06025 [Raphanus sativus]|nr:hypothetical protein Rs2_06025 [Raphanus sativus]